MTQKNDNNNSGKGKVEHSKRLKAKLKIPFL